MKELTGEQFESISNGWALEGYERVDWKYEVIDEHHVKHDITSYQFVFQDPSTGKYYMGNYSSGYYHDIEDYIFPLQLDEVEKVEVTKIEWRKVNN